MFERAKTGKATRSDPKPITVFITENALRQYELIELFTQSINDWLVKIKRKLRIEKRLTTYVARHTFSTVLKRSGVSTEFIQGSLGHANIRTTEKYLDSFKPKELASTGN